jgi:3-methyladenine DNA glycosylase AlkC
MEAFKNRYNKKTVSLLAQHISEQSKKNDFNQKNFLKDCLKNIDSLEMKERVVQISNALHMHVKGSYKKKVKIFLKTLKNTNNEGLEGFILWPYTHYIETHGLNDFETSLKGLYEITKRFTSEFGIRPFLEKDPKSIYSQFNIWASDPNEHIRRWVSEGTRPNLPWGQKISHMKQNLKKNIKILEKLKTDESLYVRKSVANHMNDISWIDADLTIKTLKKWKKIKTEEIDWIIKQALRSLLKQGQSDALVLLGFDPKVKTKVTKLTTSKEKIKEGDVFDLSFYIENKENETKSFMVDYVIHYPKANGKTSAKTFKLKNIELLKRESKMIKKKVSFKKVTTRKHYKGKHTIEIQVNGEIKNKAFFHLI